MGAVTAVELQPEPAEQGQESREPRLTQIHELVPQKGHVAQKSKVGG